MKRLVLCFGFLLLSACASYGPVQMGSGVPSNQEVISCTHYALALPTSSGNRVDAVLNEAGVDSTGVYSIEERNWWYLFPIYFQNCTVARLNEAGAAKAKNTEFTSAPGYDHTGATTATPESKSGSAATAAVPAAPEPVPPNLTAEEKEFEALGDPKKCDQEYSGSMRSRCRLYYHSRHKRF
jgi:hypothetical protein